MQCVKSNFSLEELYSLKNELKYNENNPDVNTKGYNIHCKWFIKNFQFEENTNIDSDKFIIQEENLEIVFRLRSAKEPSIFSSNLNLLKLEIAFPNKSTIAKNVIFNAFILDKFSNQDSKINNHNLKFNSTFGEKCLNITSKNFEILFEDNAYYYKDFKNIVLISNIYLELDKTNSAIFHPNFSTLPSVITRPVTKVVRATVTLPVPVRATVTPNFNFTFPATSSTAECENKKTTNHEKENQFLLNELKDFENMLTKDNEFYDVKLKLGDQEISAHKFILASRSPRFHDIFTKDKNVPVIAVSDVDFNTMEILLHFIYSASTEKLNSENVYPVLLAANKYLINGLKIKCQDILLQYLNIDNVIDNLILADSCGLDKLKSSSLELIVKNKSAYNESDFKKLLNANGVLLVELVYKMANSL